MIEHRTYIQIQIDPSLRSRLVGRSLSAEQAGNPKSLPVCHALSDGIASSPLAQSYPSYPRNDVWIDSQNQIVSSLRAEEVASAMERSNPKILQICYTVTDGIASSPLAQSYPSYPRNAVWTFSFSFIVIAPACRIGRSRSAEVRAGAKQSQVVVGSPQFKSGDCFVIPISTVLAMTLKFNKFNTTVS